MMRVPVEKDSINLILKIANGQDMQKALGELRGLLDIEIRKVAEEDVI